MKKFTLFILSFVLLGVLNTNAQTWKFDESSLSASIEDKISEKFTVDGVDLTVAGAMAFEPIAATIDGVTYSKGIYGNGTSNSDGTKAPTRRYLSFPVTGKGKVTVVATSRNTNSNVYNVMLVNASSAISDLGSATYTAKSIRAEEFTVNEAGTVYIYQKATKDILYYSVTYTPEVETNDPAISLTSGSTSQTVKQGMAIEDIVYTWNEYATNAVVTWEDDKTLTGIGTSTSESTATITGTVADDAAAGIYTYTIYATDGTTSSKNMTGTITVLDKSKKTIAYVSTSDDASNFSNDAVYTHLSQFYNVVPVKTANNLDFTGSFYDMVIADEKLDGGNDNGSLNAAFDKPFLNMKSFFYNSGRWEWGTANNGAKNSGDVSVLEPFHPIYNGITITTPLTIMDGSVPEKTIQGATLSENYADFSYNLAQIKSATGSEDVISFHEIPAGKTLGSITTTNKYIMLAISQTAVNYLNETGLAIIKNTCDYLMGGEVFDENSKKFADIEITGFELNGNTITWDAVPAAVGYKVTYGPSTRSSAADDEVQEENYEEISEPGAYSATIIAVNAAGTESLPLIESFTVTGTTAIENAAADKTIVSVKYYSTTGIEVDENATGVVIVKTTYQDGSTDTAKSVKK